MVNCIHCGRRTAELGGNVRDGEPFVKEEPTKGGFFVFRPTHVRYENEKGWKLRPSPSSEVGKKEAVVAGARFERATFGL